MCNGKILDQANGSWWLRKRNLKQNKYNGITVWFCREGCVFCLFYIEYRYRLCYPITRIVFSHDSVTREFVPQTRYYCRNYKKTINVCRFCLEECGFKTVIKEDPIWKRPFSRPRLRREDRVEKDAKVVEPNTMDRRPKLMGKYGGEFLLGELVLKADTHHKKKSNSRNCM